MSAHTPVLKLTGRGGMRRIIQLGTVAMLATLGLVAVAGPASADDTPQSSLYLKPAGSSQYTYLPSSVIQGVAPGASTTFQAKLVNTGTVAAQFQLSLDGVGSTDLADPTITFLVNGVAVPTSGWVTAYLVPGAAQKFSIKVSVPRITFGSGFYNIGIDEGSPGDIGGDEIQFFGVAVAQSSGTSPADVFLKTGSQPFVGGWDTGTDPILDSFLVETAAVLPAGSTASATIRLQNDSTTAGKITLRAEDQCYFDNTPANSLWPMTVTDLFLNVTANVLAGTYTTPTLAPNAHRDLRITIKNNSDPACQAGVVFLIASSQAQSMLVGVIATDAE